MYKSYDLENRKRTYSTYEFIDHPHPLVSRVRHAFLYPHSAFRDEVVEWPADDQDKEARESGPAEESVSTDFSNLDHRVIELQL